MTLQQLNMFGPPEDVDNYGPRRGRCDDQPVPWERENLWPADLARDLGQDLLEKLYGDIPRKTRLHVREVCRRLVCDSNHVYNLIDVGALDAADIGAGSSKAEWRVYRYSVVRFLFNREFRDGRTRADVTPAEFERIEAAIAAKTQNRKKEKNLW